jgi:hypothetical protein
MVGSGRSVNPPSTAGLNRFAESPVNGAEGNEFQNRLEEAGIAASQAAPAEAANIR